MHDIERHKRFLPLAPVAHTVMVALADANLTCHEIADEMERDSGGHLKLSATRVMETIRRLKGQLFVEDSPLQPDPENNDDLKRFYTLTMLGMQVASAETQRVARLVQSACDKKLVTRDQINPAGRSSSGSYRL